jgi:uncharacterized protein with GYD domain
VQTFILLTRLSPDAVQSPHTLETLERQAMNAVRDACPEVEWLHSYALLGPYDYLDIFRAPSIESATRVATLIRIAGRAHTEIWAATEWAAFKEMLHKLPELSGVSVVPG